LAHAKETVFNNIYLFFFINAEKLFEANKRVFTLTLHKKLYRLSSYV